MKSRQFSEQERQALEAIMLHRRDVRGNRFTDESVSDELIKQLIFAALQAPSVGFSQPWEFVIVRDLDTKQKIADSFKQENNKARQLFNDQKSRLYQQLKLEGIIEAPVNIAVFYKPSEQAVLGQTSIDEVGEYSVVCAVQNMWLMSRAMNLGLGWVSILDPDTVSRTLKAPKNHKLVAYLCIGHVSEFSDKPELEILQWEQRRSMQSVVYTEKFDTKP